MYFVNLKHSLYVLCIVYNRGTVTFPEIQQKSILNVFCFSFVKIRLSYTKQIVIYNHCGLWIIIFHFFDYF